MKKKTSALIAILFTLIQGAWAESVTFNVRSWNGSQVVTTPTTMDATVLEGNYSEGWLGLGAKDNQNDYYYVVKGNTSYKTLNCFGKVHLILADDATLTCTGGIIVQTYNNNTQLFIYSQSDGDREGKLIVTNSYEDAAGIGSTLGQDNGTIEIHGGNLDIKGGKNAAGIGAGSCDDQPLISTKAGKITIYGGVVKAEGGKYSAGIGGGAARKINNEEGAISDGAEFYLYGGEVTATGGEYGAGVGGGGSGMDDLFSFEYSGGGSSGQCRIYGGRLTAQGGIRGAGIGSGRTNKFFKRNTGDICISGGTVNATGGEYAAGIGGGIYGDGGKITISGGNITAIGGVDAAGIGGGEKGSGGIVTISGGNVRAEGRSYGAGIGGGETEYGADVTISGGTIVAIAGEDCKAREGKGGSAIGCGQDVSEKDSEEKAKSLIFPDNYRVTAGDAENNIERVFTNGERVPACRWRNYVIIEACSHEAPTEGSDKDEAICYTIDDDKYHTKYCRFCKYSLQEKHSGITCVCGKSNYIQFSVYKTGAKKDNYEIDFSTFVGAGLKFYLPSCSTVPDGYIFKGWEMNPAPDGGNEWAAYATQELKNAGASVKAVIGQQHTVFYPRFLYDYADEWTWFDNGSCSLKLTCAALPTTTYTSDQITFSEPEDLTDERGNVYGKRYKATLSFEKNGFAYEFSSQYEAVNNLTLYDGRDNWDALYEARGLTMQQVVLSGRTLWKDGNWNTLFLPFRLANIKGTPLEGATIKKLNGASFRNGTLQLDFDEATSINSGTPYLVKWDKPAS